MWLIIIGVFLMKKLFLLLMGLMPLFVVSAAADSVDDIKNKYAPDTYLIGVGIVQSSGDSYKDRRRAEILARLEIAKAIKVTIKENTVDIMCERQGKALYADKSECVNQFTMMVEESVDEVLEGSKIVDSGEDKAKGICYAVAVLPKTKAAEKADEAAKEAQDNAIEHLEKVKTAEDENIKKEEAKKAKDELKKSLAYEGEKAAIEKTRQNADELFKQLAGEIAKVEGKQ